MTTDYDMKNIILLKDDVAFFSKTDYGNNKKFNIPGAIVCRLAGIAGCLMFAASKQLMPHDAQLLKCTNRPVSSVVKHTLSMREVWGSIPWPVKSAQCRQRHATVAKFLRSCVAPALSRVDGSRYSLQAST